MHIHKKNQSVEFLKKFFIIIWKKQKKNIKFLTLKVVNICLTKVKWRTPPKNILNILPY